MMVMAWNRKKMKKKHIRLSITLMFSFLLLKYYFNLTKPDEEVKEEEEYDFYFGDTPKIMSKKLAYFNDSNTTVNLVVFDLTSRLEPADLYSKIVCRKSALYVTQTTLCVHDPKDDSHVSAHILKRGVWESRILR